MSLLKLLLYYPATQVDMLDVELAIFRFNNATLSGGAIYADESSSSFSRNEYNHTRAQNRFGFCFATLGNEIVPDRVSLQLHAVNL